MSNFRRDPKSGLLLPQRELHLSSGFPSKKRQAGFLNIASPWWGTASVVAAWNAWISGKSPILWLKMNETSGTTAVDSSGNNLNGTYGSSSQHYALNQTPLFRALGPSVNFAQSGFNIGYIDVPNNALLNVTGDFTLITALSIASIVGWYSKAVWKCTDYTNGRGTYYLGTDVSTSTIRGRVNSSSTYYDTTWAAAASTAYVVGMRRLGTELSLWTGVQNGSFVKRSTATLPGGAVLDTANSDLWIGNYNGGSVDGFNGTMNQVVLIGSGLSDADMATTFAKASA